MESTAGRKNYTPAEDALILDTNKSDAEIAGLINRNITSIRNRRHFLKVTTGVSRQTRGALNHQYIKEHYYDMGVAEIAENLNLTISGVRFHIRSLKKHGDLVPKNRYLTSQEIVECCEQIKKMYPETESDAELAIRLNISKARLSNYIGRLKRAGVSLSRETAGDTNNAFIIEHYNDMSYSEMAEALGLSPSTIPTYLNRLRKKGLIPYKSREAINKSMRKSHSLRSLKFDMHRQFVCENYNKLSYNDMANILGMSCSSLVHYVHALQRRGDLPYKKYIFDKKGD